jgi:hypothetical protein
MTVPSRKTPAPSGGGRSCVHNPLWNGWRAGALLGQDFRMDREVCMKPGETQSRVLIYLALFSLSVILLVAQFS